MKQEEIKVDVIDVDDLIPDNANFNKGNEQGAQLLELQLPRMWRGSLCAD